MHRNETEIKEVFAASTARTPAQALAQFHAAGVTIKEWAESRGFNPEVVYTVLGGRSKCLRGQAHQVAVALGLKQPSMEAP